MIQQKPMAQYRRQIYKKMLNYLQKIEDKRKIGKKEKKKERQEEQKRERIEEEEREEKRLKEKEER